MTPETKPNRAQRRARKPKPEPQAEQAEPKKLDLNDLPCIAVINVGPGQQPGIHLNGVDPNSVPTLLRRALAIVEKDLGLRE